MNEYSVLWEIRNLKAESPAAALHEAIKLLETGGSTFLVSDDHTGAAHYFNDPRQYTKADWQSAVALGDTYLGFYDWVADQAQEV